MKRFLRILVAIAGLFVGLLLFITIALDAALERAFDHLQD